MIHTLKVTLKQHTPLIHFQHDQDGATLRASEVKPKLDKYIVDNVFDNDYDACKEFLVGYDSKKPDKLREKFNSGYRALDYKIAIKPCNRIALSLNPRYDNNKRKYITDDFPLILSNMGGKDTLEELSNFSLYDFVDLELSSKCNATFEEDTLLDLIQSWIDLFFATNNFGQRQDKGFGSFTVDDVDGENMVFPKDDLPNNTRYLHFSFPNELEEIKKQKQVFDVIDFYWKCLKSGINYTQNGQYPDRYIKAFLWTYLDNKELTWEKRKVKETFELTTGREKPENKNAASFARALLGCPDKFEYKNKNKTVTIGHALEKNSEDYIARIPSPIIFKPVVLDDRVNIYLIPDVHAIQQLKKARNLTFVFKVDKNEMNMSIDPNAIDINELLQKYHQYIKNVQFGKKAFEDDDDFYEFIDKYDINEVGQWFIPLDFKWRRLTDTPVRIFIIKK